MNRSEAAPTLVFDVNETLLDIATLEPLFERLFGNAGAMREWFAQLILYSQTMTLSGLYTPFGALGVGALRMVADIHDRTVTDSDVDELKDRMDAMPAHPDVVPGLSRLRDAGFRLVTLTNSPPAPSPTPLEQADIDRFFERTFSVDVVRRVKPASETYQYVATELNVETSDLCLVACHLWDTIGAQAAGCRSAFLTRPGNAFLPAPDVPKPDFVAPDLKELAVQIIARWKL